MKYMMIYVNLIVLSNKKATAVILYRGNITKQNITSDLHKNTKSGGKVYLILIFFNLNLIPLLNKKATAVILNRGNITKRTITSNLHKSTKSGGELYQRQ